METLVYLMMTILLVAILLSSVVIVVILYLIYQSLSKTVVNQDLNDQVIVSPGLTNGYIGNTYTPNSTEVNNDGDTVPLVGFEPKEGEALKVKFED